MERSINLRQTQTPSNKLAKQSKDTDIPQRSGIKKQIIISAATKLIAEKGLKNTSVAEIAKGAGVVDSILYHYFIDKDDLLFAALEEQLIKAKAELESHLLGIIDPMSKLGKVIWYHLGMSDYDSEFASVTRHLLLECRSKKQFYQHECYSSLGKYARVVSSILEEGIGKDIFTQDFDPDIVTQMLFGLLDEESLSHFVSGEIDKSTPDFEPIMQLIFAMLTNNVDGTEAGTSTAKRTIILKAAKQLFAEKGYSKTTVSKIAKLAKVAEGTIYEYFKNKKELFLSIPTAQFLKYKNSIRNLSSPQEPLDKLRQVIYLHFHQLISDREFLMIYLHDIIRDRHFYTTDAYKDYKEYIAILDPILDEGKQQGTFNPDVNNRLFKNLFLGTFTHLAIRWFVLNKETPLKMIDEFNQVTTLLCRSVLSQEGLLELQKNSS